MSCTYVTSERCSSNLISKTSNNRGSAAFQATFSSAYKWELFFSVYPAFPFFNFWPLIFLHNARMFCPLVESEKSCLAGNYENRCLWQVHYYSKQHYFTKMLEHETVSQLTWISSQMSSSKRVAAVWCCRGAIRQWPSVRDWLLGRDKYTYKKQTKTEVPIFLALKTFPLLRLRNISFAKIQTNRSHYLLVTARYE